MRSFAGACVLLLSSVTQLACAPEPEDFGWRFLLEEQPGALLSVTGTGSDDIWIVGADRQDGSGPTVLHFDGERFSSHEVGDEGDLWWIARAPSGALWMAGDGGRVFRHEEGGAFLALPTPEPVRLFGVLPFADDDVWAVGGDELTGLAVVWHYDGTSWSLPAGLDPALLERRVIFKIWGRSSDEVWLVGEGGSVLHKDSEGWHSIRVPDNGRLVTVHGNDDVVLSVGGFYNGLIVELTPGECTDVTPSDLPQLQGVVVDEEGGALAAGNKGALWERSPRGRIGGGDWSRSAGAPETALSYHAIFRDDDGGAWAVGGFLDGAPLEQGVLTYRGDEVRAAPSSDVPPLE